MESWTKAEVNYVRVLRHPCLVTDLQTRDDPHGPAPTMVSQSSLSCLRPSWRGSCRDPLSERMPLPMQELPANLHRNQGHRLLPDAQTQVAGSCSGNVGGPRWPTVAHYRLSLLPLA